jgi:hypothetical protein
MLRRTREGLTARSVDGEFLVVDRDGRQVHYLNATAGYVWSLLEKGASVEDVVARVVEHFEVERSTATREVESLIERLETLNLVTADPEGESGGNA